MLYNMLCILILSSFHVCIVTFVIFFFKQKTAYEMRISDWSSDVCSSDLDQIVVSGEIIALDALESFLSKDALKFRRLNVSHAFHSKLMQPIVARSEERRVGKECVSTCRSRWSRYH